MKPSWTLLLAFVALGFLSVSARARFEDRPKLLPMPAADLTQMNDSIRNGIKKSQADLQELEANPDTTNAALAVGYGQLGVIYHAHGLFDAAVIAYLNAHTLDPTQIDWIYLVGYIHQTKGELQEAADRFKEALSVNPKDLLTLVRLGNALLDLNQLDGARDAFQRALAEDPKSAGTLYGLGRIAVANGDHQQAVGYFERALEIQPKASVIHYPLGLAYRRVGNLEKSKFYLENRGDTTIRLSDARVLRVDGVVAISTLQTVIDMAEQPQFSAKHFLGFVLGSLSDKPGMIQYMADALDFREEQKKPEELVQLARLRFGLGGLYEQQDDKQSAIANYKAALELDPSFVEPYIYLANVYARLGRFEEEIPLYQKVLELDPGNQEALLNRAKVLTDLGRHREALADLRKLAQADPANIEVRFRLAMTMEQLGEDDEALKRFQSLLEQEMPEGDKAYLHTAIGKILQKRGKTEDAMRHFNDALHFEPGSVEAKLLIAGLLAYQDRFEEAVPKFAEVIAVQPDNAPARLGEVAALVLLGRYEAAKERLEDAHTRLPDNPTISHLLARMLAAAPEPALRGGSRALELAEILFSRQDSFSHAETLAMAMAQAGRYREAANLQRQLIEAAGKSGASQTQARLQANLARYESGRACCEQVDPSILLP